MKKTIKLFGFIALVALIGLSMTACNKGKEGGGNSASAKIPNTSGRLTINKIPSSLDGKYAMAFSANPSLIACDGFSGDKSNAKVNLGRISGGSVTLNVWKIMEKSEFAKYNGNDKGVILLVGIMDTASVDNNNVDQTSLANSFLKGGGGMLTGTFSNGKATVDGSKIFIMPIMP